MKILLTTAFFLTAFPLLYSHAEEVNPNALIYIDAPEVGDVTDEVDVTAFREENGQLVEQVDAPPYDLEAGQLVSLKTQNVDGKKSLVTKEFQGRKYYEIPIEGGGSLYVDKADIDVRGFYTGKRTHPHILRESSQVISPNHDSPGASKDVTVYLGHPSCINEGNCKTMKVSDETDLKIIDAQMLKVKDKDGKEAYRNFLLAQDPMSNKIFWINAEETGPRSSDEEDEVGSPQCENDADPIKDLITQSGDIKNASAKMKADGFLPYIGQCVSGKSGKTVYVNNVRPKVRKERTINGQKVTADQMEAIDLISRTIYGEMQSCNQHGSQYMEAVGKVIMNRMNYAKKEGAHSKEFTQDKYKDVAPPYGEVIFKDSAFSLWNSGDPAGENALCPENPLFTKSTSVDGKKRSYGPAVSAYKKAVEVAADMVLHPEEFQKKTKPVKQLFYTSAMEMKGNFSESPVKALASGPLKRQSCIRFWASNPIRKRLKSQNRDSKLYGMNP
jgi:hypothetical protein